MFVCRTLAAVRALLAIVLFVGASTFACAQVDDIPPIDVPPADAPPANVAPGKASGGKGVPDTGKTTAPVKPTVQYGSLDDLPIGVREQFDSLYKQHHETKDDLEAAISPELATARERLEFSRKRERDASSLKPQYDAFSASLAEKGQEATNKFTRWRRLFIESTQADYCLECGEDAACRKLLAPFAKPLLVSQLQVPPESRPTGWDKIQPLLPVDPATMTEEQALEMLLAWSRNIKTANADELAQLQDELQPPEPVRDHIAERHLANVEFAIYDPFVQQAKSDGKVADLEARVAQTHQQLTEIWPNWEQGLKEGPYSYLASLGTPQEPLLQGRRWLLVLNVLVIIALALFFFFRGRVAARN